MSNAALLPHEETQCGYEQVPGHAEATSTGKVQEHPDLKFVLLQKSKNGVTWGETTRLDNPMLSESSGLLPVQK